MFGGFWRFAAEDAARLAEVMSFALAACVVAERFAAVAGRAAAPGWRPLTHDVPESAEPAGAPPPRPFGALLLARLAGEAGLGWLGQEPAALRALAAYFGDGPSELRAIAEEAERRIGLALDRGPAVSAAPAPPADEAAADRPAAPEPQPATADSEPAPERPPPRAIGGEGAGWEWVNWVLAGLRDGSVPVNAPGAWLHNIEGEAYTVSPACFEAFAAGRDIAAATVRNRVVRLERHRQRASPSGAANVFRAVLADGSRVKGMVFPGELVWDDDPPPRANASLVGKGRGPTLLPLPAAPPHRRPAGPAGRHPLAHAALRRPRTPAAENAARGRRCARDRDRRPQGPRPGPAGARCEAREPGPEGASPLPPGCANVVEDRFGTLRVGKPRCRFIGRSMPQVFGVSEAEDRPTGRQLGPGCEMENVGARGAAGRATITGRAPFRSRCGNADTKEMPPPDWIRD